MMKIDDNPFERWHLDPRDSRQELTESMRTRCRELGPDETSELQKQWRHLISDPVARARWIALSPRPITDDTSLWEAAASLVKERRVPASVSALRPTLEDGLVLPLMEEQRLYAKPPFLPTLLKAQRGDESDAGDSDT